MYHEMGRETLKLLPFKQVTETSAVGYFKAAAPRSSLCMVASSWARTPQQGGRREGEPKGFLWVEINLLWET